MNTNTQHTPGRIDSTAFRRGVRAAKTDVANPYNGPTLRDEWEAGRAYAKARNASAAIANATKEPTQHSPGPWDRGRADGCTQVYDANGRLVANVEPHAGNSCLIATSPEMLAALRKAVRYGGLYPDLKAEVEAVIAKATGGAA